MKDQTPETEWDQNSEYYSNQGQFRDKKMVDDIFKERQTAFRLNYDTNTDEFTCSAPNLDEPSHDAGSNESS